MTVAGCGSTAAPPQAIETTPFPLQVKFANVDLSMEVRTAAAFMSPGDNTHVTLDLWNVQLEPGEAFRAVGHITRSEPEELGIAIELYGEAALGPGNYVFGSEYPNCCVPSITYGGVEYQLAPHPSYLGQVSLESVDMTEGGTVRGSIDVECYYGEIVRGSFTAIMRWR